MKTAIFGGSFDPIHLAHLFVAEEVCATLGYDRVLFVPAATAPHKTGAVVSAEHRLAMVRLAIAGNGCFAVTDWEIERGGLSYTVDTLRYLISTGEVGEKPGLILGTDLLDAFSAWREPDAVEELANLIVVRRPGSSEAGFKRAHVSLENSLLAISSREVRARVGTGRPYRYVLPPEVAHYIESNGLYR